MTYSDDIDSLLGEPPGAENGSAAPAGTGNGAKEAGQPQADIYNETGNGSTAVDLARRGFAVFPILRRESGKWTPVTGWQAQASADPAAVARWWRKWPDSRVGLLAGERNGVTVLDLDIKNGKDGVAALAALGFADLAALSPVRVRTKSGGWHLYFHHDARLKNSVSRIGDGIDVKTTGGFVVAPGSLVDGKRYQPEGVPLGATELPALPEALIPPPKPEREPVEIVTDASEFHREWAADYLAKLASDLAATGEGARADTLNSVALWAGGAAAHGFLTRDDARAALLAAADAAGLPKREAQRTFANAFDDGLGKPISDYPPDPGQYDGSEFDNLGNDTAPDAPKAETPRLRFLSPGACADAPSRGYVVKGILAPGDVACIFGAPGAGKSLISPHIGYAVAQGREAFGMRTKPGRVFYVAAEDPHGMRGRVSALKIRHGDAPEFTLVEGVSDLLAKESPDLKALYSAVKEQQPALIFVDTLAMSFPGLEENSAEAMGRVVAVARKLASHGAAVVLIHHDTKAQGDTPRGHSLLNGALDVALHLFPRDESGVVRGSLTKNRNGTCDRDIAFRIATEAMGEDEDGDPITFALVAELAPGSAPKAEKLNASERAALDVLKHMGGDADEDEWRATCIDGRAVSSSDNRDNRKRAFNRALASLVRKDVVTAFDGKARLSRLPDDGFGDDPFDDAFGEGGT